MKSRTRISSLVLKTLFSCIAIVLLHDYYLLKTRPIYKIYDQSPNFTLIHPYKNTLKHRFNIEYNKLVDINFTYLINPKLCSENPFLLIIVVSSDIENAMNRQAIRDTWGKASDSVKIVFTMALRNDEKSKKKLITESNLYEDIVQGDFIDSYRNLTYKHMMGLKWVYHHCNTARYILKTDDDVSVNYRNLMHFLVKELSPWGAQYLIACIVWLGMPVLRTNETKWFVSKEEFEPDIYPRYCSGSFIIYSQDVLPFLIETSQTTKYLFVDDAYVTGIVAGKVGITRTDISPYFINYDDHAKLLKFGTKAIKSRFLFGPMNVNHKAIRKLWNITQFDKNNKK